MFSNEDFSYEDMLESFIRKNSEHLTPNFDLWVSDCLKPAFNWILRNRNEFLNIGFPSIVNNVLSHTSHSKTKNQFLIGMWRGFYPFINSEQHLEFVKMVI